MIVAAAGRGGAHLMRVLLEEAHVGGEDDTCPILQSSNNSIPTFQALLYHHAKGHGSSRASKRLTSAR
jgi:hypothetical protein